MGPRIPFGSARGEDCTKSRTDESTREEFTQVRAARMRNTLLLLGCIICVLGQLWELQYFSSYACRMGLQRVDPPLSTPWASFYMRKGLPQVAYEIRNEVESNYSANTVLSYLTLTA